MRSSKKAKVIFSSKNVKSIVDFDIDNRFLNYKWSISIVRNKSYFVTGIWNKQTKKTDIFLLHRLIMNAKKGEIVDHINGDTLDNRKQNLRICSNRENIRNSTINRKNNTSGYKGVHKRNNSYTAAITYNYKKIHIGSFETAKEAALAYNKKAIELFGKFAKLNEIT